MSGPAPARQAAGDGGDDGNPIPRLQGSGLLLQRPHVLVVHEDTDVAPQRARPVQEPVADALVARLEGRDQAGDVRGLDLDLAGATGERPHGPRNLDANGHTES